ncbi:MAG: hypothetical protein IKO57_11900 [Treponema sp.]|nr:hypothetical protein [Treponema sp.]MBR4631118.1 hypothetical protein [Treponema sp.]
MKKRTLLGLCLSIFSLFLFSCGIAESNDGSATLNVDTATIVQRSIKSANFELSEDEIFEKYAEYLNYELTAIVNYEIGGKSENKTFSLLKMNGKEAMELVEKLQNMSGEEQEEYFTDKFKSQTLTIENLPVGKTATFKMKIRQKIGFDVDLSKYEGLSESEISKDEYLAISKEPVSTKISENTDITIKLREYDKSLDWEYKEEVPPSGEEQPSEKTVFSLTFTGTIPSEFADSVTQSGFESDYDNNMVYIFRKVNGKWGLNDSISIKAGTDFTLSGSTIKGSAVTQREFPVGDTVAITMRLMHQTKTGDDDVYEPEKIFIGWSNEITLSKDGNDFDMGELTYKNEFYQTPAPETIVKAQINSTKEITAPYATVVISNAENEETIAKEEFKFEPFSAEYDGEVHYVGIYIFDSTDEFNNLEDGTKLLATINLYEDEARTKSVYENSQGTQFYKKCQTDFYYQLYDGSSESGSSGTGEQILGLNLFDANGGTLSSILGTNFYYAVVITDSAVDDISTASPLFSTVGSSDGSTSLMFRGDAISSILSSQAVYITFGIFETEDEAQTATKTGEVSNGIYYCKNYPVSIETGNTDQYIDVHLTEN